MANNKIIVKRTTTSGRQPNTTGSYATNSQYIGAGELALNMADGILYSSNGSAVIEVGANNTNVNVSGNLIVKGIIANGSIGTAGQVLTSNGSATYWSTSTGSGTVTSVATGNGMTGGTITSTGTVSVVANTGIVANATGVYVNAAYINTIASNSATYANSSVTNTFTVGTATYFVSNGNIGIGNSSPVNPLVISDKTANPTIHLTASNSTYTPVYGITAYGVDPGLIMRKSLGTQASPSAVTADTRLGFIIGSTTADGITFNNTSAINFMAEATANATSQPTYLQFMTTSTDSTSRAERMRISGSGNVGIGNTAPNAKLQVTGTANVSGNVVIGGDLSVVGTSAFGAATIASTTSPVQVSGDISLIGSNKSIHGNLYYAGGWKYGGNGYGWGFREDNAGKLQMLSAGNNTSGAGAAATVSLSDLFTFDLVNNRVGLGNTAPNAKLQVTGTANVSSDVAIGGILTVAANTSSARYILTNTNGVSSVGDTSGWMFTGAGYVYLNQSGYTYSQSRIVARSGISDDVNATLTLYGGTGGYTTVSGSTRSPLFYDSDNTGYYTDPASLSTLNRINFDTTNVAAPTSNNAVGTRLTLYPTGDTGHYSIGIEGNHMWFNAASGYKWYVATTNWATLNSDYFTHTSDIRTPIFYDSDDTGYYVNPNDTSQLKGHTRFGPYAGSTSTGNVTGVEIMNNGGTGDSNAAAISFHCQNSYGVHLHLRPDGYFGAGGWSASSWRWYVYMPNGDMTAAGNVVAYSDIRLKEDITNIVSPLEKIRKLNGVKFKWKNNSIIGHPGEYDYGILAHEVQEVIPEIVTESMHEAPEGDKYKTVAYDKLIPVLIEAMKEQQSQIEALRAEINTLKGVN